MSQKETSTALTCTNNFFRTTTSLTPLTYKDSGIDWQHLFNSNKNICSLTSNAIHDDSWYPKLDAKTEFQVEKEKENHLSSLQITSRLLMMRNSIRSVQSNNHYIFTNNEIESPNETSVEFTSGHIPAWEVKSLKQGLLMQLINHPLKPLSYEDDTGANVIEFYNLKSHFVYIADDEGIQIMWTKDSKPHSKFIPDNEISLVKITNDVAQLMSSP